MNIQKHAAQFRRQIKTASFENLKEHAHKLGYLLLFTETKEHKDAVAKYNLPECPKAYAYVAGQIKLIVINKQLSPVEIRLLLLHEIAHIELGHMDCEMLYSALAEIEANAFAYFVIRRESITK